MKEHYKLNEVVAFDKKLWYIAGITVSHHYLGWDYQYKLSDNPIFKGSSNITYLQSWVTHDKLYSVEKYKQEKLLEIEQQKLQLEKEMELLNKKKMEIES